MSEESCLGCEKRPEVYGSSWCAYCHGAIPEPAKRRMIQMRNAILWALGENGEFTEEPPPLAGKYRRRYWWRTELRKRAFDKPSPANSEQS